MQSLPRDQVTSFHATFWGLCAAIVIGSQIGCASFKMPSLSRNPTVENASAAALTPSQIKLKSAVAEAAYNRGDVDQAIETYNEILRAHDDLIDVRHQVALIHDKRGDFAKAQVQYQAILERQPNDAKVLSDFGYSLYLQESFDAAEQQLNAAVQADPRYLRARLNLGLLLARTGRIDDALSQFELSGLNESQAHCNIAMVAAQQGDAQTASTAIKRCSVSSDTLLGENQQALANVIDKMTARQSEIVTAAGTF
ncbi:MAG: tetratricopeptide repeat protein [Pirellulaceae bacterium]|nr:tetratricopeptide repeat protein [Pirellulaceae bacterium]